MITCVSHSNPYLCSSQGLSEIFILLLSGFVISFLSSHIALDSVIRLEEKTDIVSAFFYSSQQDSDCSSLHFASARQQKCSCSFFVPSTGLYPAKLGFLGSFFAPRIGKHLKEKASLEHRLTCVKFSFL